MSGAKAPPAQALDFTLDVFPGDLAHLQMFCSDPAIASKSQITGKEEPGSISFGYTCMLQVPTDLLSWG